MSRINRAIQLLELGQPVYYTNANEPSYQSGLDHAQTWADFITVDLEHHPFATDQLHEFMRGLVDGGPTRSGHRTPAVVVTLPTDGGNEQMVRTNSWMMKQALAVGVHGLLLCHVESANAVKAFVEASRYPFHDVGVGEQLGQGRRGSGGQALAAEIWGLSIHDYLQRADVWPLNPNGEIMLGLKIENRRALEKVEKSVAVPGIALAEWGPGDMGMSFGYPEAHDPPYPPEMKAARQRVKAACDSAGTLFLEMVDADNVIAQIDDGVKIAPATEEVAAIGREYTKREMVW